MLCVGSSEEGGIAGRRAGWRMLLHPAARTFGSCKFGGKIDDDVWSSVILFYKSYKLPRTSARTRDRIIFIYNCSGEKCPDFPVHLLNIELGGRQIYAVM